MGLFAFHYHVVDVSFHVPSQLDLEDLSDQLLISGPSILETEGHNFVIVGAICSNKGHVVSSLGFILI